MSKTFKDGIFEGKVLFITGGRTGIGYDIAKNMMQLGANAVIVGRDAEGLAKSAAQLEREAGSGKKCIAAAADVRDKAQVRAAVSKALEAFGKIDFVVCAAAGNFLVPIDGLSENGFKTVIDIDLLGTYNTIKATLHPLRETQGSYIHISATLHYRGTPYQPHVSAAKAGIDALSNVLAVEEGPRGIRSNVIAPGPIGETEGMKRLGTKGYEPKRVIPLGRQGYKQEISDAAVFLFSDAGKYITGQTLVVDGGHRHLTHASLPYPEMVLEPEKVKAMFQGKL